jgi:hypothetical protein
LNWTSNYIFTLKNAKTLYRLSRVVIFQFQVSTVVAYAIFEKSKNAGESEGFYTGLKLMYGHFEIPSPRMFTSEGLESRRFRTVLNEVSSPIRIHRTYRISKDVRK